MATPLPLPTLLSRVLVASTIEFDNEAEHRRAPDSEVWLVSQVMWENVLRYLESGGLPTEELHRRARTTKDLLAGLQRWGYVTVDEHRVVHLTRGGSHVQKIWRPLSTVVETRWSERFGPATIERLRDALTAVTAQLDIELPRYLPIVYPTQHGRTEDPASIPPPSPDFVAPEPDLSALLSRALHAFTLDYESQARLSLSIAANTLRVLDDTGVRVRDLPQLTGVSKEGNAMCVGFLVRHACVVVEPDPAATRGKRVRLTPRGMAAQRKYQRILAATEHDWNESLGHKTVTALRNALEFVVEATSNDGGALLMQGIRPYPEGWRASVRTPETLPHFPMVLHRGGFPDGS